MSGWIARLRMLRDAGTPAVLVTVAATRGSVPREPGTKMIITRDRTFDTIGGGHLEYKAIEIARGMLDGGERAALQRFVLGASLGQCCGGIVELLFERIGAAAAWPEIAAALVERDVPCVLVTSVEPRSSTEKRVVTAEESSGPPGSDDVVARARALLASEVGASLGSDGLFLEVLRPPRMQVVLFGAGHVGQALVRMLSGLPCRITWVDSRDDAFPQGLPGNVTVVATGDPEAEADAAVPGSHFLVMTHSHDLDLRLCERILAREDFVYFGLIGSATKRRRFEQQLMRRGVPPGRLARMTCPIGVDGITDKHPAAIAVAVAAEILQAHERGSAVVRERDQPKRHAS
ncbi:MAG TPA: xanthine dehydrogenase accessory protein XdhC [Burkholderiales bacterium]|nr:xanthine dehydrogenase accessory protein XdhC [Burkholderiales bacterium]